MSLHWYHILFKSPIIFNTSHIFTMLQSKHSYPNLPEGFQISQINAHLKMSIHFSWCVFSIILPQTFFPWTYQICSLYLPIFKSWYQTEHTFILHNTVQGSFLILSHVSTWTLGILWHSYSHPSETTMISPVMLMPGEYQK